MKKQIITRSLIQHKLKIVAISQYCRMMGTPVEIHAVGELGINCTWIKNATAKMNRAANKVRKLDISTPTQKFRL